MLEDTEKYRGYTYVVAQDMHPWDPRDGDNLGIMAMSHRRYNLGDKVNIPYNDFNGWDEVEEYIRKTLKGVLIMPVYMYDHSNICISLSPFDCPWDSGRVGFIFTTRAKISENFGVKRARAGHLKRAEAILKSEIESYNAYISGSMYIVNVYDENGEDVECMDGFIDTNDAEKSAKELIDYCLDKKPSLDKK